MKTITDFIKWFFKEEFNKDKIHIWQQFFMNKITLIFVLTYIYMTITNQEVSEAFDLLLGIIVGFYFKKEITK